MKECGQGSCSFRFMDDIDFDEASRKYPKYTMICQDCQHEFAMEAPQEEVDKAICPACQSANVKNLYISFPTDGPGFKKKVNGFDFGGCN